MSQYLVSLISRKQKNKYVGEWMSVWWGRRGELVQQRSKGLHVVGSKRVVVVLSELVVTNTFRQAVWPECARSTSYPCLCFDFWFFGVLGKNTPWDSQHLPKILSFTSKARPRRGRPQVEEQNKKGHFVWSTPWEHQRFHVIFTRAATASDEHERLTWG